MYKFKVFRNNKNTQIFKIYLNVKSKIHNPKEQKTLKILKKILWDLESKTTKIMNTHD